MTQQRDRLERFLLLIDEIASLPGNEWFKLKLEERFPKAQHPVSQIQVGDFTAIREGIKYVALAEVPVIDYSGVLSKPVQNQLIRDCVEMGRYKLGKTDSAEENFGEFCRYAHLQAEELLNYFYFTKFSNVIPDILVFIQENSNYTIPRNTPRALEHLPYTTKLFAYKKKFRLDALITSDLLFLNDIRNELSHRNSSSPKIEESVLQEFIKNGWSNFLTSSEIQYLTEIEKETYNKGLFIINKRVKDFGKYYATIELFKQSILANLKLP